MLKNNKVNLEFQLDIIQIFNDASDSESKLAQDLVAIAVADDNIAEVERQQGAVDIFTY